VLHRNQGKSQLRQLWLEYVATQGGTLVSDEVQNNTRLETYQLPDGRKWTFMSPAVPEED
jgi:hypothetical protein